MYEKLSQLIRYVSIMQYKKALNFIIILNFLLLNIGKKNGEQLKGLDTHHDALLDHNGYPTTHSVSMNSL